MAGKIIIKNKQIIAIMEEDDDDDIVAAACSVLLIYCASAHQSIKFIISVAHCRLDVTDVTHVT